MTSRGGNCLHIMRLLSVQNEPCSLARRSTIGYHLDLNSSKTKYTLPDLGNKQLTLSVFADETTSSQKDHRIVVYCTVPFKSYLLSSFTDLNQRLNKLPFVFLSRL